jgi:hypothetical protein
MSKWTMVIALLLGVAGCQAEPGQRCDGSFTNTCRSPSTCVSDGDKSVCGVSCSTHSSGENMGQPYCEDSTFEPVQVMADTPQGPMPMGCHCVPK